MKNNKELDYTSLLSKQSDKVIVAFHGWQGNKDSFLPLAKNSLFKDYNWFLLEDEALSQKLEVLRASYKEKVAKMTSKIGGFLVPKRLFWPP